MPLIQFSTNQDSTINRVWDNLNGEKKNPLQNPESSVFLGPEVPQSFPCTLALGEVTIPKAGLITCSNRSNTVRKALGVRCVVQEATDLPRLAAIFPEVSSYSGMLHFTEPSKAFHEGSLPSLTLKIRLFSTQISKGQLLLTVQTEDATAHRQIVTLQFECHHCHCTQHTRKQLLQTPGQCVLSNCDCTRNSKSLME